MDQSAFRDAEPFLDQIADCTDGILDSSQAAAIRDALTGLSTVLGERYSVGFGVTVEVFDQDEIRSLPLLRTGLATSEGQNPYRTWGDSTLQRYVIDGEIQVVPHDHCPKCWHDWDFKLEHQSCPHCGATLGEDCKLLLDSDTCPHCEEGAVSAENPTCAKCGFTVDSRFVAWG